MNPLPRLLGAAASHGLLTGQIVFSTAFVGACELPNWLQGLRQVNACLERSPALGRFFSNQSMRRTLSQTNQRLGVSDRAQAIGWCVGNGLLPMNELQRHYGAGGPLAVG